MGGTNERRSRRRQGRLRRLTHKTPHDPTQIRELFAAAIESAPALVFIDEVDAITQKRETSQRGMERRIVAQLLTCLDSLSLENTQGRPVLVIGATNRPDSLDPALRRAGRFDREIALGVPDQDARRRILQVGRWVGWKWNWVEVKRGGEGRGGGWLTDLSTDGLIN